MPHASPFDVQIVFWILVALQAFGLVTATLARRSVGCRGQKSCQWLFAATLVLVGLGTVVAMGISSASWLFSAGTLALMIVAAVWDVGPADGQQSS